MALPAALTETANKHVPQCLVLTSVTDHNVRHGAGGRWVEWLVRGGPLQ